MSEQMTRQVIDIITSQLDIDAENLNGTTRFHGDLGVDSIDVVNIVNAININFGVRITEQQIMCVETIDQMVQCIRDRTTT